MAGINRATGKALDGWGHVVQSLHVLFTTHIGARLMRRYFGSEVPPLLGENLTARTVTRFCYAIVVAIELWEPRFRVTRVYFNPAGNKPDQLRSGKLSMAIHGQYLPRGHLGDPTPARGDYILAIGAGDGSITVQPA
ncbi:MULTISPECIES: GPW/gp25 family protein [unclassified Bradyrhizobium]|uniref:GPW/gp25 family protein n=1 Tax=unclassified Bradyrhizobium TaxID=2631580 RepID=UPI0028EFFB15|nr:MULTISPECIES: GPW/gp25 family protein [unclassified Bradyrhizobium]